MLCMKATTVTSHISMADLTNSGKSQGKQHNNLNFKLTIMNIREQNRILKQTLQIYRDCNSVRQGRVSSTKDPPLTLET